ncbi:MAG TPA: hypothetical protein VFI73_14370 [Candidatus Nitrosopolaris sp.]|nr:hypothetical protein [Candidatus Nitrosopolaris sp.]
MAIIVAKSLNHGEQSRSTIRMEIVTRIKTTSITTTKILSFIFAGILLFSSIENADMTTHAQLSNYVTNNSTFPSNGADTDRAPGLLDAYWTNYLSSASSTSDNNNSAKKEVGPGDGASTLAVVIVNRGRSDITGVTGYLTLPIGFSPIPGKNNGTSQSVASAYSIVKAGGTFVLYFDMNVLKQAKVGGYSTSLILKYTKINQIGQLITTNTLPFRLTGRVILDAVSENSELIPSTQNQLKLSIHNIGSANAAGAVVTVTGITSGNSVTSSNTQSASSSFSNTNSGNTNTSTTNSPSSSSISSPSSSSTPAVNIGATVFHIGTIPVNGSAEINPVVYPTASSGETVQNLNLQISYGDAYGNRQTSNVQVGLVISPNPPQSVVNATANNGNALIVAAGKIQDIDFTVANSDNKKPITNVVISLVSQSNSMKILGDSRWTFQSILSQSRLNLSTKVFASSDLIGKPALFTLTVDYVSAGQSKTDSLNIGTYVSGDIKIRVYDVAVNFLGSTPNIIGNLLNEGNTVGLFTTVELVKSNSSKSLVPITPPTQYLGDLSVDSPLPFSMALNIDNRTLSSIQPGIYPITLKITYSDDLKTPHVLLVNTSVDFEPKHAQSSNGAGGSGGGSVGLGILLIAAIAVVLVFLFVRRRRSKSKRTKLQSSKDVDLFLDDVPPATSEKDTSRDLKTR